MMHEMRLHEFPFFEVKSGRAKIEVRLNDIKRRKVKIGDTIVFRKRPIYDEEVKVKVSDIRRYKKYSELLENEKAGKASLDYYSSDEIKKYGFVVFQIKLLR